MPSKRERENATTRTKNFVQFQEISVIELVLMSRTPLGIIGSDWSHSTRINLVAHSKEQIIDGGTFGSHRPEEYTNST